MEVYKLFFFLFGYKIDGDTVSNEKKKLSYRVLIF